MDLPSQMEAIHSDDDLVGLITAECDHRVLRNIKSRSKSETKASKTSTMNQKKKKTEPVYEQVLLLCHSCFIVVLLLLLLLRFSLIAL